VRLLRPLVAALAVTATAAAMALGAAEPQSSAQAQGYAALLPGGTQGGVTASSGGPTDRSSAVSGLRPAGGGSVGSVSVRVEARGDGASATADGTVSAGGLSLLDGRVSVASLRMSAHAGAGPSGGQAGLTDATVSGLVVDGQAVSVGLGSRVEVAGIGTLVLMEHVTGADGSVQANALRVEASDPAAAAIIGQPFVIGHLSLSATPGTGPAEPESAPRGKPAPRTPARAPEGTPPGPAEPSTTTPAPLIPPAPLGLPRQPAPKVALPAGDGYVFPVFGDVSFTDDYGAPRSDTGWHQGNDLFAPTGTPVLAVADGRLSRVGVNTLGGNRLWLTDEAGNSFYYAHLSAYAPAALEGARVRAGQVIAFVGNTGDAITTPPHLHFEVHPGGGDSVDPYPYLIAWERGTDIPPAFRQAAISPSPAPAIGAVLVDISPAIDGDPAPDDGLASPAS
jgi:murein DD-endopeptidase MepM/ murein hydrolase activator NlpD